MERATDHRQTSLPLSTAHKIRAPCLPPRKFRSPLLKFFSLLLPVPAPVRRYAERVGIQDPAPVKPQNCRAAMRSHGAPATTCVQTATMKGTGAGHLWIGRIDLFHFFEAHFKLEHVGNAHGADSRDRIIAHIGVGLKQLPGVFEHTQADHKIAPRWHDRVDHPK